MFYNYISYWNGVYFIHNSQARVYQEMVSVNSNLVTEQICNLKLSRTTDPESITNVLPMRSVSINISSSFQNSEKIFEIKLIALTYTSSLISNAVEIVL